MADNQLTGPNEQGGKPTEGGLLLAKELFLRSQLAELFEIVRGQALNTSDFGWRATTGPGEGWKSTTPRLVHAPSGFYFDFYFHDNGTTRAGRFRPGQVTHFEHTGGVSWAEQKGHVQRWLTYLKREIEAPDVWDMVQQEREALASTTSSESDNTPFIAEEKTKVFAGLEEIRQYLLTAHKLNPELVEARIKYLEGAAERVGRFDWKGLVISTIFGILVEAAVPSETFHDVFRFVGTVLREIYKHTPLLGQ